MATTPAQAKATTAAAARIRITIVAIIGLFCIGPEAHASPPPWLKPETAALKAIKNVV
ncbi:hypothetical protein NDQ41_13515 [Alcaligenes faecalis]|uniref:Uncharacterized protein n=1 Tax=Alcaligenes faecalis TaxID=511 RepID=A0AAE9KMA8_ALCFA|nr:hypothetical protein [Alcaligenes faecalis]MCM2559717.1 hypothetical protein [Alcaligenes faecalis]MCM2620306.1 hypothetical protein [Alcaligenes faecalis]MDK7587173.1 hypothetical protein [Alcaligenes phenolicus]UPL20417.1 hypothetical protein MXF72_13475 [Alcaligenes faecalis]